MKRENNQNDDSQDGGGGGGGGGGNKRNRQQHNQNDDQLRILIPSRIAGAIIGKGGQHIQKMRSTYKCTMSVDDCQGPERTILVYSDFESIISIVKDMLKYYEDRDDEVDVRLLIHQSLAGCIIGKGGSKIKEIRDKIGCRVLKVFSNTAPQSSDRVVQIIGKQDQAVDAVKEVLSLTKDTPIRGPINNYDPINFDDVYSDEYGGYGGGGSQNGGGGGGGGGGFRDRESRFDRGGRGGDRFGGDRRRDDRSRSGGRGGGGRDFISPWANDGPIGGGSGGFGGGFGSGGGGSGGGGGGFGGFGSGGGSSSFGGFGSGGGSGGGFGSGGGGFGSGNNGPSFGGSSGGGFGSGSGFGSGGGSGFGGGSGGGMGNGGGGLGSLGGSNGGGFGSGGGGGGGGGMNGSGSGGGGGGGSTDGKNSTQVTIPKDLAGAIIGKAGGRIRRIRNESNAYITIDEPLPGSTDRIITISGSPKQIQMAQYLLQQSVHENRRNN